jgi:hypothetical protein
MQSLVQPHPAPAGSTVPPVPNAVVPPDDIKHGLADSGATGPITTKQTDFLTVALAARDRGFTWIVPVDDKAPLRRSWLKFNVTSTRTELNLMAVEFPHRDVGIVLKGHAGSIFVWDIDKEGVTERMKLETGNGLPETYVVQSRPETAPHKRHVYFRQSEHFASKFQKQVNAGDYDLKGFGGGQVVAEGCFRKDTGEVRTGNGLPVCDIPDWLTDWLKKDSGVLVAAIRAKQREDTKALARLRAGDLVPTGNRTLFLTNLASRLFENRVSRRLILEAVTEQSRGYCEDGGTWAASSAGRKKLRSIANDATFRHKRVNPVYLRPKSNGSKITEGADARRVRETAGRVAEIKGFRDSIPATEVYRRLELDKESRAAQSQVSRDMKTGGFVARRVERQWVWERAKQLTPSGRQTDDSTAGARVTGEMVGG